MAKLLAAPTKNAVQKTLAAQLLSTATTGDPITFDDVDGIPNLPGVLVINRVNTSGTATPSSREYIEYSGTSGSTVLITTRNVDGSNSALTHPVGSIVEFIPDVVWSDRIYDTLGLIVNPADISSLKANIALTTPTLTSPVLNTGVSGTAILDDDTMATASATTIPTSESVKAYVDAHNPAPRTTTEVSSATPTINTDNTDIHTITALATAITSFTTNLSGTPVNGQKLIIRIKDNGTARAITWGASFASRGATLPTTTVLGKYQYNGFIWNSTTSTWDCVATINEA